MAGAARELVPRREASTVVTFDAGPPISISVPPRAESVRSHYRDVFRFVRRRVNSNEAAEDLTQEVFANAAELLARSSSGSPPNLGWLYTVARRRLIDEARRRRVATVPLESVPDVAAAADEYGGLVARGFHTALSELPDEQRRVLLLRLLEGRSFREIGTELGATEEACRMRFMRGLEQIRAEFEREGLKP